MISEKNNLQPDFERKKECKEISGENNILHWKKYYSWRIILKKKVFHRYMWGKKFLTPEVWKKIIISTKSRIHPSPTNVQWSCQPFRGLGKKRIWYLSKCHPSMKWLARVIMLWFSRLKFCISRLKKRRWKIQMKREIQWNAQFPFCGQTKAFHYEVVFRGIEPRFYTADRSAWFVFNQPRQRGFWRNLRYILYFMVKELRF